MGPYIARPRGPNSSIDMGDGITVIMPALVGGPHQWRWGDNDHPHQILLCTCGWEMRWSGSMTPNADRIWQQHRQGRDNT